MMLKNLKIRLGMAFMLAGLILSACGAGPIAKPTEREIIIDPNEGLMTEEAGTPIPTPTMRATPTPIPETVGAETEPTPTNTLNPYETLIFEGIQLRVNEQFEAALAKFEEAMKMNPNLPTAYLERGITYSNTGKFDEAITDFNFAINYDPASAAAYNARGVVWAQKEQYDQAVKDYNRAIELDPTFTKAITNLAIANMLQNNYEEGLKYFTQAIDASPDDPEMYFNRGQAYLTVMSQSEKEDYIDLCIADFSQVLAFQPEDAESLFSRGLCQSFKGNFMESLKDYSAAIQLNPERAIFFLYRAVLYPDAGTQAMALSDAQKVLEISQDPDMRSQAEMMLTEIPKTPEATAGPTPTSIP